MFVTRFVLAVKNYKISKIVNNIQFFFWNYELILLIENSTDLKIAIYLLYLKY